MYTDLIDKAFSYLGKYAECSHLLKQCKIYVEQGAGISIVIDSPCNNIAIALSKQRQELRLSADLIGWGDRIKLKLNGHDFDVIPVRNSLSSTNMIVASTKNLLQPKELLDLVSTSSIPTYVTLLSRKWEWGMPIQVALASAAVSDQAGRIFLRYHGQDIAQLYDKPELERQTRIITQALEESPKERVIIKDLEYYSYGSDRNSKNLRKNPDEKYLYNADFEVMSFPGLGIIRICHCKERERVI